jgi:hypothetical protein
MGMEAPQRRPRVVGVRAIPVLPCAARLVLAQLSAPGTPPVGPDPACRANGRRRAPRQGSIAGRDVRLPVGREGVGAPRDLDRTRRVARLSHAAAPCAGERLSEPPGCPWWMGTVTRHDPAPGWVRVVSCGPSRAPWPHAVVKGGQRLAPEARAGIVRPASHAGGQGVDARGRGTLGGWRTQGVDPGRARLATAPARGQLARGRLPVGPRIWASGLPDAVDARGDGRHAGLSRRPPHATRGADGGKPRPDRVVSDLPRMGGAEALVGPSSGVAVVAPPVPAAAVHHGVASLSPQMPAPR